MKVAFVGHCSSLIFKEGDTLFGCRLFLLLVAGGNVMKLRFKKLKRVETGIEDAASMFQSTKFGRAEFTSFHFGNGTGPERDFVAEGLKVRSEGDGAHHQFSTLFIS